MRVCVCVCVFMCEGTGGYLHSGRGSQGILRRTTGVPGVSRQVPKEKNITGIPGCERYLGDSGE